MVPIFTVDRCEFREMLQAFDSRFQCPHRNVFSNTVIPNLYTTLRDQVGKDLQEAHWYVWETIPVLVCPIAEFNFEFDGTKFYILLTAGNQVVMLARELFRELSLNLN